MKGKKNLSIESINEESKKAELIEVLTEALETPGCKVLVACGLPNDADGIDINVRHYGHKYAYEAFGFCREVGLIIDSQMNEEED